MVKRMKILVYGDVHFSKYSSILRSRGDKYSTRLEYLIKTLNWLEQTALDNKCDFSICLGDFFDKPELDAEEISALSEIYWADIKHFFLVGNHEMASANMKINSTNLFSLVPGFCVIESPQYLYNILCLPYILESDRKNLSEYITKNTPIILSHNDIAGIQMGSFLSTSGFSLDEIEKCCDLFLNGHIHNRSQFAKNAYNVGNICGQNFSEDASIYSHSALILDLDKRSIMEVENPYALNFYKLDFCTEGNKNFELKNNAVITVKCNEKNYEEVKNKIDQQKHKILACKYIVVHEKSISIESQEIDLNINHLEQFKFYVEGNIGSDPLTLSELEEVIK